jgi:hypothetical protein
MMNIYIYVIYIICGDDDDDDHHHHHEEEEELPANPSKSLGFEETSHQILSA